MKLAHMVKNHHQKGLIRYRAFARFVAELLILNSRRDEWSSCKLTKEQKAAAKKFMKENYGKTIPLWWHRLYTSHTGVFDEKYFPEILFSTKLEEILNPYDTAYPLGNKAFNPQRLFSQIPSELNVRVPKMYMLNCNGAKWDAEGNFVSDSKVNDTLCDVGEVIIKPTLDTTGARGVRLLNIQGTTDALTGESIEEILKKYKADYIIQERVKNNENIRHLYPDAINTLRIITFVCKDGIHIAPIAMRLGMGGKYVDNDGIYIGMTEDGYLNDIGFSRKGMIKYTEHPDTKVKFEGYKIDGVTEMVEAAKKLHSMLPQLKILSWDLTYGADGKIVIIEVNTHSHSLRFPQMMNGKSFFGEHTAEMYSLLKKH